MFSSSELNCNIGMFEPKAVKTNKIKRTKNQKINQNRKNIYKDGSENIMRKIPWETKKNRKNPHRCESSPTRGTLGQG
jgi:hypothetical protein